MDPMLCESFTVVARVNDIPSWRISFCPKCCPAQYDFVLVFGVDLLQFDRDYVGMHVRLAASVLPATTLI